MLLVWCFLNGLTR